ncbi:MAG: hypothetical protein ABJA62_00695 [Luteimonas sp.]
MNRTCPHCGNDAALLQVLYAALAADDVDAAIELGLLRFKPSVAMSENACTLCRAALTRVIVERDARRTALAARERYRLRQARLTRLAEERAASRVQPTVANAASKPSLPPAAAAALARAKAKAAGSA